MAILGIGVDVLHVPRVLQLIRRRSAERFAHRILSPQELAMWDALPLADPRRTRFLAVRWSVKEAAYKAIFSSTIRPIWKDFTFYPLSEDGTHKPTLIYHPQVNNQSVGRCHASVSHDGDYVFTTVLVETRGST